MPTYTYITSANMPIGSVSTGITLAPNECITYVQLETADGNNNRPHYYTNRVFPDGYKYYYTITDSDQNDACQLINLTTGSYIGIGSHTYATSYHYIHDSFTVGNAKLKGKTLFVSSYGTNSYSGEDALISSDITFIESMLFTITTDYQSVSITSQANPTSGGTVTSISGSYDTGATINITATPKTGYVFDRWVCGGIGTFADYLKPSTTYTVGYGNDAIVAHFAQRVDSSPKAGRYNGEAYDQVDIYQYNGSSWVQCEAKRYNGSSWDSVDTL